jgi:trehalose/maltose transport system substrate-binding protein
MVWTSAMAPHLVDVGALIGEEGTAGHHPKLIETGTVDGRLIAVPWSVSVGLLYFRYDLLMRYDRAVPRTWAELEETASYIQAREREAGHDDFWGFVFQGAAYEGLTCNALEWIASADGGNLVDEAGNLTLDRPAAVAAVERAASWVGDIAPPRVVSYNEEATRLAFQRGNALFMRNWPYAWQLMQRDPNSPISGLFLAAPMPAGDDGGMRAGTLGGWYLAVSRYSKHPEEAASLVRYLTSELTQSRRAIDGSLAPTRPALYRAGDVLRSNPGFAAMLPMLERAVLRPSRIKGADYMASSEAFARRVNAALAGDESAAAALAAARKEIESR